MVVKGERIKKKMTMDMGVFTILVDDNGKAEGKRC
jgi:hypothetical protein